MGATWGMVMDEIDRRENEEEEVTFDPEREAYYKDDPKKALKKYFDREGLELEYEVEEEGSGRDKTYIARVTLPIESGGGQVVVEENVRGRKKEAVFQCALKACRILDSNDMLRAASQRRQRVTKNWEENDYYDSDEDSFLDRTGELEEKRRQRMKRLGKLKDQAENYDSLVKRFDEVMKERQSIEARLNKSKSAKGDSGEGDPLDQYMSVVSSQLDPATVTRLKRQSLSLRKEEEMIKKVDESSKTDRNAISAAKVPLFSSLHIYMHMTLIELWASVLDSLRVLCPQTNVYDIVLHSGITSVSGEERLGGTRPATTTTVESSGGGEGQNRGVGGDTDRDGSTDQSGGGTDPLSVGPLAQCHPASLPQAVVEIHHPCLHLHDLLGDEGGGHRRRHQALRLLLGVGRELRRSLVYWDQPWPHCPSEMNLNKRRQ
ncbi:Kanadaptin [Geodia barretti]|uniref:Kanadaptin n=1 Tax=Geodia barretti TaxID=519541 RepID=A0AA35SLI5_GEOBA|nr:Kanadaptin [Geodia barretti]